MKSRPIIPRPDVRYFSHGTWLYRFKNGCLQFCRNGDSLWDNSLNSLERMNDADAFPPISESEAKKKYPHFFT
jgi:hypothetical protein